VERAIQTVKKSLKKAHDGNKDPYFALLVLNTTPGNDNKSPAALLFGRQPRSTLPSLIQSAFPPPPPPKDTRAKTKERYDQHAKDLPDIQPGTVVRIRAKEDEKWNQLGKVVEKCAQPRSYRVLNDKGNVVRRNRRHLIPCKDRFQIRNDFDYDDLEVTTRPSSPEPPNEIVTRSGRVVRKPTRYS
jgi:hypothetical protein